MRIGVLGTGVVGRTIGSKLVELDHEVTMGSRRRGNETAVEWARTTGRRAHEGTFADAAAFGEAIVNATAGAVSLEVLRAAGERNLEGKLLLDIANPIAPDTGFPPVLAVCNTQSLAEQIQREFPRARVVKTLNTVNAGVMVNPRRIGGTHAVFVSGDDANAKAEATELLHSFGWTGEEVIDLGGIQTARGPEMYLALWLRLMGVVGTPHFNIRIVREGTAT